MTTDATQKIQDKAKDLQNRLGPELEEAQEGLRELNERVTSFIKERPGTSLIIALTAGYLVGRIASR